MAYYYFPIKWKTAASAERSATAAVLGRLFVKYEIKKVIWTAQTASPAVRRFYMRS